MLWARMLSYVTGTVNQELLLRNEYLGAENRILRGQIKGRLLLSEGEKATTVNPRSCTFMKVDDYADHAGRLTGAIAFIEEKLGKPVKK
jgi:hypothetical protein